MPGIVLRGRSIFYRDSDVLRAMRSGGGKEGRCGRMAVFLVNNGRLFLRASSAPFQRQESSGSRVGAPLAEGG